MSNLKKGSMKYAASVLLSVLLVFLFQIECTAQAGDLTKGEVLKAMNNLDGLGIGAEKESALKEANSNVVDKVFDIAKSDMGEEEKMTLFRNAQKENEKVFEDILGEADFKKYKKKVKKELKPLKRKAKLVGFLL